MSTENYFNLAVSDEQIRINVLTNIIRMMIRRKYINSDSYKNIISDKKTQTEHKIVASSSSEYDEFDNTKILQIIPERSDNGIYVFNLDNPTQNESAQDEDNQDDFDTKTLVVKIFNNSVKDVSNSPQLNEFLKLHAKQHKIVVFDDIADKVFLAFRKYRNAEVFSQVYLMMDMMSHVLAPMSCEFVTHADMAFMVSTKFSWMHENDPLCRYYAGKVGQIMRIIRPSTNNVLSVSYRRIDSPKPVFDL
jgi:hypothetical protein